MPATHIPSLRRLSLSALLPLCIVFALSIGIAPPSSARAQTTQAQKTSTTAQKPATKKAISKKTAAKKAVKRKTASKATSRTTARAGKTHIVRRQNLRKASYAPSIDEDVIVHPHAGASKAESLDTQQAMLRSEVAFVQDLESAHVLDRKSTRLNSSH